jgi:hypothetical protein
MRPGSEGLRAAAVAPVFGSLWCPSVVLTFALSLGILPMPVGALVTPPTGTSGSPGGGDSIPTLQAVPVEGRILIDGRLDEPAWEAAPLTGRFIQGEPIEGVPAEFPSEVRVLFDDEAIYIGARLSDPDPSSIARQLTRRGEEGDAVDWFEVSLDTNRDRRTAYAFRVTAAGVQADRFRYDDVSSDEAWESVWEAAVAQSENGWTVELRIPLSQLRFESSEALQSWGLNFARFRVATNELSYFALESRERFGGVSAFGELTGLRLAGNARHLEVRPYILGMTRRAPVLEGDPFFEGMEHGGRVGADVRYGLGSTFMLDLAINPDFGQVEADPAVINLTAFETFFPERRPFFTRDDAVFDFNVTGARNNLFYSRRIGRRPQGRVPAGAEFSSVPTESRIRTAGKITGRTTSGLEVGALLALVGREEGWAAESAGGEAFRFPVEPGTAYGAVRVHQELRDGESRLGMMLTATRRSMDPDDLLFGILPQQAYTGGIDFEHTWGDRAWELLGMVAGSRVSGSSEAILALQTSPTHYFQRPDASHLQVDSATTTLTGGEWRLQLSRRSGRNWTWSAWTGQRLPGFEINDLGFGPEGERMHAGGRVAYQQLQPGDVLRSYRFSLFGYNRWRHEVLDDPFSRVSWSEAREAAALNGGAGLVFLNYWGLDLDVRYDPEFLSGVLTRGGPRMIDPAAIEYEVALSTDRRNWFALRPSVVYGHGLRGGGTAGGGVDLTVRPVDWFWFSLDAEYSRVLDVTQFVTSARDDTYAATYGRRYVFSDLRREEVALEGRLDMVFSPSISLQIFAQPLVSSGKVAAYKQLLRPSSFDFHYLDEGIGVVLDESVRCAGGTTCTIAGTRYVDFSGDGVADHSFSDRDFTVRSLRASTVLRWEYRPGSTAYLVWQHRRRAEDASGLLSPGRDLMDVFRLPMENVLMIKLSYWLGV